MPGRAVFLDSDVVIALVKGDCLFEIATIPALTLHVTEVTQAEVSYEVERRALSAAIDQGSIVLTPLTDLGALQVFGRLLRRLGPGEAAAIAQAQHLGAAVAMHDIRGRKAAAVELPPRQIFDLEDLFVTGLRLGALSPQFADRCAATLKSKGDYGMPRASQGFQVLLDDPATGLNL